MNKIAVPAGIYICSTIYFISYCLYGINLYDEGIPLYGAVRVLNGQIPLVDFWAYMPGRYYLYALVFGVFGEDLACIRIMMAVLTGLIPTLAFLISRRFVGNLVAMIPVILILAAPGVYYTRFYTIFTMVNMYLLGTILLRNTSLKNLLFCLSLVSLALFFKFEVGLISGLVILLFYFLDHVLLRNRQVPSRTCAINYLLPCICLISSLLIWTPYFHHLGAFVPEIRGDIKTFGLGFNLPLFKPWELPGYDFDKVLIYFEDSLFYMGLLICAGIIVVIVKQLRHGNAFPELAVGNNMRLLIVVLLFFIFSTPMVFMRFALGYVIRILPPAHILGTILFFIIIRGMRKRRGTRGVWSRIVKTAFLIVLICIPVFYMYDMIFEQGFFLGSIGQLQLDHVPLDLPNAGIYCPYGIAGTINEVCTFFFNHTQYEDRIVVFPYDPIWLYLCQRNNPIFYDWTTPGKFSSEYIQQRIIAMLDETEPEYAIMSDFEIDSEPERRFSRYAPMVDKHIRQWYAGVKTVELNEYVEFEIMKRQKGRSWFDFTAPASQKDHLLEIHERIMLEEIESDGLLMPAFIQSIPGKVIFEVTLGSSPYLHTDLLFDISPATDRTGNVWARITIQQESRHEVETLFNLPYNVSQKLIAPVQEKIELGLGNYSTGTVKISFETGYDLEGMLMGDLVYWIQPRILEHSK